MKRKPLTDKDGEVRELTWDDVKRMRPAKEVLPPKLYAALTRKRGQRGPQKLPTKQQITLRLDRDVLDYFRASGAGWQSRLNDLLKAIASSAPR